MVLRFAPTRGASVLVSSSSRGPTGNAATIAAGTATALAEGSTPTVTNSGSSSAATFNFGIPRGVIPALGWNFSTTTTDSDPGSGNVRFNNATPSSVTAIYIDNADRDGNTQATWLDQFDDGGTSGHRGVLTITPPASPTAKLVFDVTGSVVDGTGYRKLTVAWQSGSTLPSASAHLAFTFARDGAPGSISGSTGSTDNRVLRSDGTGGTTLQNSSITIDDSGNIYPATNDGGSVGTSTLSISDLFVAQGGVLNFANGNYTVTHSTGTLTLSGSLVTTAKGSQFGSATGTVRTGALALSDVNIALYNLSSVNWAGIGSDGSGDVWIRTGISGTPSAAFWVDNTQNAGVQNKFTVGTTIELGHASDTTLSRVSAGVMAIEGITLAPNIPVTTKSTAYTAVLADANTCIMHPTGDNNLRTFTIDSNANVAYPIGTTLTFANQTNTVMIAITSDTLTLAGIGSTGVRTLAANGMATALKVASTSWFINGAGLT